MTDCAAGRRFSLPLFVRAPQGDQACSEILYCADQLWSHSAQFAVKLIF
jgi:hypothetical protein